MELADLPKRPGDGKVIGEWKRRRSAFHNVVHSSAKKNDLHNSRRVRPSAVLRMKKLHRLSVPHSASPIGWRDRVIQATARRCFVQVREVDEPGTDVEEDDAVLNQDEIGFGDEDEDESDEGYTGSEDDEDASGGEDV